MFCVALVQSLVFYDVNVYPADIAKEWVSRAAATNDLNDMAKYLKYSDDILKNYHGNPAWPFPTPDTDYDQIRTNVEEVIRNALTWSNQTGTSMAYQQAVHNIVDTLSTIYDHLNSANQAIGFNPYWNPLGWLIWSVLSLVIFIIVVQAVLYPPVNYG